MSSHELLSLPKTNMKNKGTGNVTGLKLENRPRTQSRTRSPISRSLLIWAAPLSSTKATILISSQTVPGITSIPNADNLVHTQDNTAFF